MNQENSVSLERKIIRSTDLAVEEKFFNTAFTKQINGEKRRCGRFSYRTTQDLNITKNFIDHQTASMRSVLKRIIGDRGVFVGFKTGPAAVKYYTDKFNKELKNCLDPETHIGKLFHTGEFDEIYCLVVSHSGDHTTFEGTHGLELLWYAEYLKDGQVHTKPIIHTYNSGYSSSTKH